LEAPSRLTSSIDGSGMSLNNAERNNTCGEIYTTLVKISRWKNRKLKG
jgi:hypothetical protein